MDTDTVVHKKVKDVRSSIDKVYMTSHYIETIINHSTWVSGAVPLLAHSHPRDVVGPDAAEITVVRALYSVLALAIGSCLVVI